MPLLPFTFANAYTLINASIGGGTSDEILLDYS
jgi:hypothetical protein